jgi:hypothetical protein
MDRKKAQILADAIFEIAKKYDTCGDLKCNLLHATIGVWMDKDKLHEAIELAKQKGFDK